MNKVTPKFNFDIIFRYISRPIAIRLIKPIGHTFITANQISALSMILAIVSAVIISFSNYTYNIIACLILQLVLILDCIDGMLARYHGEFTKFGLYWEYLWHEIVPPSLFFALGINSYKYLNNVIPLYLGGMVVLFIFFINISRSSKERIVLYHIQKTKKKIPDYVPHTIFEIRNKSPLYKFVNIIIEAFNSPGHLFTILLVLSLLNVVHYTIFFYSLFYFVIAITKMYLELKQGFKPYGLE